MKLLFFFFSCPINKLSQNDLELYLKYLNLLYDKETISKYINKYITTTQDILLLSYRYRNMIVHNAQYI